MVQYSLECIAFQLVFLIIYDLFLKRETFFQWNRLYLIGTYIISMVLPWIKIEAMKTTVPDSFQGYPEFLWNANEVAVATMVAEETSFSVSWEYALLFGGMLLASLLFGYKLYQIYSLRKKGTVTTFSDFTQIIVANSAIAFSFFKSIFLGDKVIKKEHQSIIDHELVHIRQKHSYDLLFFEVMRIVGWFNPLVYIYQSRVSELHEFIADAQVAKTDKKEQYEFLLSQVFQTQHISFINQFFKSSLIKKRIVMLTKEKSKQVLKLKYLLLLPLVFGMLAYTSYEASNDTIETQSHSNDADEKLIAEIDKEIEEEALEKGSVELVMYGFYLERDSDSKIEVLSKRDYFKRELLFKKLTANVKIEFDEDRLPSRQNLERPLPTTKRFNDYVRRKKAYQILDENLKYSIAAFDQDIILVENGVNPSKQSLLIEVGDIKALTGKELRNLNDKLAEVFEGENSTYTEIILTDSSYVFKISNTDENSDLQMHVRNLTFPIDVVGSDTIQIKEVKKKSFLLETDPVPFATVDNVPVFPGCEDAENKRSCFNEMIQKHISKNFNYPQEAQEKGIQGQVSVMFTVAKNGSITNIRKRGPHKLLEKEVARIIGMLPKMKAGKHNGKKVDVPFSIPVMFKLDDSTESLNNSNRDELLLEYLEQNLDSTSDDKTQKFIQRRVKELSETLLNKEIQNPIKQYNQLVLERQRLLKSTNEKNPIIVNLDRQLNQLKSEMNGSLKGEVKTVERMIGAIKDKNQSISMLNQLIEERNRLLKSANSKNPIIANLDERIEELKKGLGQDLDVFPFAVIDEVPIFPGCENHKNKRKCFNDKMQKHISKNFNYPQEAQQKGIQGQVSVMFTIAADGSIQNIRKRGPNVILENETERIIKKLPKMKPGKHKGKAVNVPFSIPINFKLQDEKKNKNLDLIDLSSTNDKSPLFIIDGKESSKVNMTDLNPDDIESINVLKDESAIRKYGDKGKNGVIEIITKKK